MSLRADRLSTNERQQMNIDIACVGLRSSNGRFLTDAFAQIAEHGWLAAT